MFKSFKMIELVFLSSLLIRIRAEELLAFNFLDSIPLKHNLNKTEINLNNYYSWHEPTENAIKFNKLIDTKLTDIKIINNLLNNNLVNNNNFITNNSDLNLNQTNSSFNFISNLTTNLSSDLSNYFLNSSDLNSSYIINSNLTDNLTDLTTDSSVNTLYDVPLYLVLLLAFAYGLVSLTAVVGNSIVLWFVVRSRKLRTVTNIFIANLAISDILIGALSIPFQFQAALLQRWVLPNFLCPFCSFIQIVSVNVSIFTLSSIAADRYLVVFYPIKYRITKKFAKFIIAFIWIFSVLAAIPALIALRVVYIPDLMNLTLNQELSSALLNSLVLINVNNTSSLPDLFNVNSTSLFDERPTRPSNTLFWLDDLLPKIDSIENKDEKLYSILNNFTLPSKPHCGNVGLSPYQWKMYNLFLVLIQYFIPLIVITFAYTKMGLKLKETDRSMNKRTNKLQRINTASSQNFSTSSTVRTTNNNLIVSPGTGGNIQMELQHQTGNQTTVNQIFNSNSKRCRSLDCSPMDEPICLMNINERKCSQSDRHSPQQCINCNSQQAHVHNYTHSPQQQINSTNVSIRSKHSRTSCNECCREYIMINNNECLLNKNSNQTSSSIKKINQPHHFDHCIHHNCNHHHHHHHSIHRNIQSPSQQQNSPQQYPLQHHSSLQPTGSIHSNLMMPIISHPISALRENPQTEYIVINKKKVIKMLFVVYSLFAFLWLPLQSYNLLKDFFFEINGYKYINVIWFTFHFMAMLSASTNPFVYAIYSLRN